MLQPSPTDRFARAHGVRKAMWRETPNPVTHGLAGGQRSAAFDVIAVGPARWVVGDWANILYQAAEDYDTVIISTS